MEPFTEPRSIFSARLIKPIYTDKEITYYGEHDPFTNKIDGRVIVIKKLFLELCTYEQGTPVGKCFRIGKGGQPFLFNYKNGKAFEAKVVTDEDIKRCLVCLITLDNLSLKPRFMETYWNFLQTKQFKFGKEDEPKATRKFINLYEEDNFYILGEHDA